jgi:hypothetical protein
MGRMAGSARGTRDGTAGIVVAVVIVLLAVSFVAILGIQSMLGLLLLVVVGVAALVGRALPGAHLWVALAGVGLAVVGVAVAALAIVDSDDRWADLVLALWIVGLGTVGCAWGAGIWLGRSWRRRRTPLPGP